MAPRPPCRRDRHLRLCGRPQPRHRVRPSVISEGFTLSLLTAVLLKLALEVVIVLKTRFIDRLRAATTKRGKAAAAVSLWVVAAGSSSSYSNWSMSSSATL